ncbi:DUF438 domain-containing protein [Mobilitalea sibirica]|uniref:DUF438 domain-containing protein n=1 Tax=Mobilitalea sibirica TaxID=1462919 RepID=A0A8J7L3D6_9FIRM|nr:DUF438 domain-containing protein [Mobilitalea sibirica]MBH1942368.1 DUF438 domain-containing protein [Mobilitalea sibirica]
MSEYINNREYRQKVLKELILELHDGKSVEEVKERFSKLIEGISPTEISVMENALIKEGMPVEEVQRLCDVHAAVFKGSIEEIHQPTNQSEIIGHPVHTFKMENRALERLMSKTIEPLLRDLEEDDNENTRKKLLDGLSQLWEIDKHYLRKENLLFPYMEKYGITAPPKVMWGVDDEIRADIKDTIKLLKKADAKKETILSKVQASVDRVNEMIFKEENILFPMVLDTLDEDEWLKIAAESGEIGYCIYEPIKEWKPARVNVEEKVQKQGEEPAGDGYIRFDTGIMSQPEIEAMLNTLPVDVTFVDKDGVVKYFTQGKERIFPRTKAIIGRKVQNCHPPASVHVVEKIVEDLQSGKKDHEDFWIRMGEKYILIRYFAVRDKEGNFLGTLEFTQDIGPIKMIEGEKRLMDE